jgi:phosphoglycerate dehydrogenase-like enzyme
LDGLLFKTPERYNAAVTVILNTPDNSLWKERASELAIATGTTVVPVNHSSDIAHLPPATREHTIAVITLGFAPAVLDYLPNLRMVAVPMAGLNTLPMEALRSRSIQVVNAHANGMWVAERAVALIMGIRGRLAEFDRDLRNGVWHGFAAAEPPTVSWRSLYDTTVSVLGTGSIGQWLARFLSPFGVRCRGFRRHQGREGIPEGLFDEVGTDITRALSGADLVVSTLPLTDGTRNLIGYRELRELRGGFLVNVGRGEVIQEEALFRALRDGTLAGAALDTWYRYPDPPGSTLLPSRFPFHELDNVLLSPHLGGYNVAATRASAQEVTDAVARWITDGAPADRGGTVDLKEGY